jgi:hypothetical protein
MRAWRDKVRLLKSVVPRRPPRAVPGDDVIVARHGLVRFDCADCDRVGRITRRRDAAVACHVTTRVAAEISCGDNDNKAGRGGVLDRLHERII